MKKLIWIIIGAFFGIAAIAWAFNHIGAWETILSIVVIVLILTLTTNKKSK